MLIGLLLRLLRELWDLTLTQKPAAVERRGPNGTTLRNIALQTTAPDKHLEASARNVAEKILASAQPPAHSHTREPRTSLPCVRGLRRVLLVTAVIALLAALYELTCPSFIVHSSGAILITGASSGLGRHLALTLAARNFTVFAGVRRKVDHKVLLQDCQLFFGEQNVCERTLKPVLLDVTDETSIHSAFELIQNDLSRSGEVLIGLVNNAGIQRDGPVELVPLSKFRQVMQVNYLGVIAVTQTFLPLLRESQGRIIMISALAGRMARETQASYASSKFALEGISESLRRELAPLGVAVILINPGTIATPLLEKNQQDLEEAFYDPALARVYAHVLESSVSQLELKHATTPESTSQTIVNVLFDAQPNARYFVARANGYPTWAVALAERTLPTQLTDYILLRPVSE
eukprot:m.287948 g.287948  ORF g.287948 m.287948 type:complete len:406 (+) comp55030_c0_seq1:2145-3362(+)